jgi:hypothetical protein
VFSFVQKNRQFTPPEKVIDVRAIVLYNPVFR